MRNARNSPQPADKLACGRVEPAIQRGADELIAILVASARTARARVDAESIPRSRSHSLFRIRPFPPLH